MAAEKSIATFYTTHAALRAEKLLKREGIVGRLVPTPRHLSADCTMALLFMTSDRPRVEAILEEHGVDLSGVDEMPWTDW